jgi:integrase
MLTGQRRGEIAALRSTYLSHNQQTICLPPELTKNGREHTFPVGAIATLLAYSQSRSGLLFPARGRDTVENAKLFNGWSKSKAALDKLSGVTGWTLHDLRRTFRTTHAKIGTPPHIAERLINHVSSRSDLEEIYDLWTYMPEMKKATELFESHMRTVLRTA